MSVPDLVEDLLQEAAGFEHGGVFVMCERCRQLRIPTIARMYSDLMARSVPI